MKKIFSISLYLMIAVMIFGMVATGCSKDDSPTQPQATNIPEAPIGTATCTATITLTSTITATVTVTVTPTITPIVVQFVQQLLPNASYNGTADTYMTSGAGASYNYGSMEFIGVGNSTIGTATIRALVKFDIACGASCVPAGAQIISATVELYPGSTSVSNVDFRFYACTEDWVEGTQTSGTVSTTEASWNKSGTSAWTTAGGSPGAAVSDTHTLIAGQFAYNAFEIDPSVVQGWLDSPSTNYGMVLMQEPESTLTQTSTQFRSKEFSNSAQRPKLTIKYSIP